MNKNPSGFKEDISCANVDWGYAALEESDTESEEDEILENTLPQDKIKENINDEFKKRVLTFKESLMVNIINECLYCKLDGKIAKHVFEFRKLTRQIFGKPTRKK